MQLKPLTTQKYMDTNRHAVKQPLLHLMKQDDHQQAIKAVLLSGLLPEPQLRQWLYDLVERAIRGVLDNSGCPEWENWAANWLSGKDRSAWAAWAAVRAAAWVAARAAEAAAWVAARAAEAAACAAAEAAVGAAIRAAGWAAGAEERKAQYVNLLFIINSLPDEASSTKLLHLMKNDDHTAAVEDVLNSGLLPEPQLQQWLDNLTERAVRRVLAPPGCTEWAGRASWDAWAVKWLHSKDRSSIALVKATKRIIAATTREAQQIARNGAAYTDALIWAAAEAARASHREPGEPLRHHALKASWAAIRSIQSAAVAAYGFCSTGVVAGAFNAERERQYQGLLSLINSLPNEP